MIQNQTVIRVAGSQLEVYLLVQLTLRTRGIIGDGIPDVFNIKAAVAPHSIIQKEVDDLSTKVPLKHQLVVLVFTPSILSLSVLVVYGSYSISSNFNHLMQIPSFMMPTMK